MITAADRDPHFKMDAMYRYQRHFYDLTRKFYLLGRDRLLDEIEVADGYHIAEIGCGTGRNLEILASRHPQAMFCGLDASAEMLATASRKLGRVANVRLAVALADDFTPVDTFGFDGKLDAVFFSYSLSMIPTWRESIENALRQTRDGGAIYIVDFFDQKDLPRWFQALLKTWLRNFHVQFWADLMPFLHELATREQARLSIQHVARRYAYLAKFEKR